MKRIAIVLAALMILVGGEVWGQDGKVYAAREMIESCERVAKVSVESARGLDEAGAGRVYQCVGAANGALGALIVLDKSNVIDCKFEGSFISNQQAIQAFLNYVRARPKVWGSPFAFEMNSLPLL